jgi:CRP-like cAMP-binding protein
MNPLQPNYLLAALPESVQGRIFPHLESVTLPLGQVIYESGDSIHYVLFPTNSIISLLYVMESGASAEISVVGSEGMVGLAIFMGGNSTPSRAIVQSGGHAYRLKEKWFKDELNRHGQFMLLLLKYTQALITQMAQTAVCNRHQIKDDPGVDRQYARRASRGRH